MWSGRFAEVVASATKLRRRLDFRLLSPNCYPTARTETDHMPLARFWEFAHLSDDYKDMGWVDQCPRAGKLYIGGLHALYQKPDLFQQAGITHIVSVVDFDIYEGGAFKQYQHLMLRVDDDPNENLLKHFGETNAFIEKALSEGGGVFVHCVRCGRRSRAKRSADDL